MTAHVAPRLVVLPLPAGHPWLRRRSWHAYAGGRLLSSTKTLCVDAFTQAIARSPGTDALLTCLSQQSAGSAFAAACHRQRCLALASAAGSSQRVVAAVYEGKAECKAKTATLYGKRENRVQPRTCLQASSSARGRVATDGLAALRGAWLGSLFASRSNVIIFVCAQSFFSWRPTNKIDS